MAARQLGLLERKRRRRRDARHLSQCGDEANRDALPAVALDDVSIGVEH